MPMLPHFYTRYQVSYGRKAPFPLLK